ncbi:MAG: hypothetical protein IEMM0008_1150 [bacterium]|nr:MAG: hypothetical protein IEMM0008_1150 [bacterium]
MKKYSSILFLLLLWISISTLFPMDSLSQTSKTNYISSNYFSVSVFRNFRGFVDWKRDFLKFHEQRYGKVSLKNYDTIVFRLKEIIADQIEGYKRNPVDAKHFDRVVIPAIFINRWDHPEDKLQVYCNGKILEPKGKEIIGDIRVHLYSHGSASERPSKSFLTFKLVLFTFSNVIANQNVVLSLKNDHDFDRSFNVGEGLIVKDLLYNED